ncbi:hypothetical protein PR048_019739, partial [Dryococelus australis]
MRVTDVSMEQRRNEGPGGGGGTGNLREKPADQRHRPARFSHVNIRSDPAGDQTRIALVGSEQANRSATMAPKSTMLQKYTTYTRQKAKSKYRNRIRLERASQRQSSDTLKRCRERKKIIKVSERVNIHAKQTAVFPTQPTPIFLNNICVHETAVNQDNYIEHLKETAHQLGAPVYSKRVQKSTYGAGAALECNGRVNGRSLRKQADKRHRPARFPRAIIQELDRRESKTSPRRPLPLAPVEESATLQELEQRYEQQVYSLIKTSVSTSTAILAGNIRPLFLQAVHVTAPTWRRVTTSRSWRNYLPAEKRLDAELEQPWVYASVGYLERVHAVIRVLCLSEDCERLETLACINTVLTSTAVNVASHSTVSVSAVSDSPDWQKTGPMLENGEGLMRRLVQLFIPTDLKHWAAYFLLTAVDDKCDKVHILVANFFPPKVVNFYSLEGLRGRRALPQLCAGWQNLRERP